MAQRKWKGKLTKDLLTMGDALENLPASLKKGDDVVVWKRRKLEYCIIRNRFKWSGKYEFHYEGTNGGFARTTEFFLEENK